MDNNAFPAGHGSRAQARAYACRALKRFFTDDSPEPDVQELADFLQYAPGAAKVALPGTAQEQLTAALSTIRFRRPDHNEPCAANDIALLDEMIARSDQQNKLTARFLRLLD